MVKTTLHVSEILGWADAFHKRFGRWPRRNDGIVTGPLDLTWCAVDQALKKGRRGLLKGSSLAQLLLEERGVRNKNRLPPLSECLILAWADAHRARTGKWPSLNSGPIEDAPGETWLAIDKALRNGKRHLAGNDSLGEFLVNHRGVRNNTNVPRLSPDQVLGWADAHRLRTGAWPTRTSGPVEGVPDETWYAVDAAFVADLRGLVGFGSLAQFLANQRGLRNQKALPHLQVEVILQWVRAFRDRTGRMPTHISGPIPDAPGETWGGVHGALQRGTRGLPKSSLYRVMRALRTKPSKA